jgi:opacity protein-like surface antigen
VEGDLGGSSAVQVIGTRRADQGVFASAAVRLAVPFTQGLRGFVRGGYAYHAVTYDTGRAFHGSGWTLGGGGEADLTSRVFVRGEYRFSDYGQAVRGQQFLLGAGIRF